MSADGRARTVAPLVVSDDVRGDDADAMWRPGAAVATVAPPVVAPRRRRRQTDVGEPSPWSREAADRPLPTIAEVRERWRRELAVDDVPDEVDERPTALPAQPRRAMSVPHQPPSSTTGDVVLGAMSVLCLAAAALLIGWAIVPPAPPTFTDVLPPTSAARWRVTVDGRTAPEMLDANASSVAIAGAGELIVLDADTGEGRWRQDLPLDGRPELRIYGDTVVVVTTDVPNVTIAGYDLSSGSLRWGRTRDDTEFVLRDEGLVEYVDTGATTAVRILDPATGVSMGPAAVATDLSAPPGYEVGRTGNSLVLIDVSDGQAATPPVPDLELKALAVVDGAAVGFTQDAGIVLFDRRGQVVDQRGFVSSVRGDFTGRAELVGGVPSTSLGIVASGSSIAFDVSDDRVAVAWELLGRVGAPVATEAGPIAHARTVHPVTAEIDVELVDLRSGESIEVTDLGLTREADPVIVRDGYVATPALGDPDRVIEARGFDGTRRWSLATPLGSWFEVLGGRLYVVDPSEGTLTAHG